MTPTQKAAMEQALEALEDSHQNINPERSYADELIKQIADAITALRAALAETAEPVKFLANGTRFKMSFFQNEDDQGNPAPGTHVTCFEAFEEELDGRWVALVPAEDDCHRKYTAPQPPAPAVESDDLTIAYMAGYHAAKKAPAVELTDEEIMEAVRDRCADFRWPSSALSIARAAIAAHEKKRGKA